MVSFIDSQNQNKNTKKKFLILSVVAIPTAALLAGGLWFLSGYESPPATALNYQQSPAFCNDFSDLNSPHPGMAWIPGGEFSMGAEYAYFEEGPRFETSVQGFWMDVHEVTNAEFEQFVNATGYQTLAERGTQDPSVPNQQQVPGAAVFVPFLENGELNELNQVWWKFVPGANWRQPEGPGSSIEGREHHPVVHIAYEDAQAYAEWADKELPTEKQFEYAARGSVRKDMEGHYQANTWQGFFPLQNNGNDGYIGSSPVGCFAPNQYGLYDMIGNVWEWTSSPYYDTHAFPDKDKYPDGFDPNQPNEPVAVIKGGSFLCAPNYCMRYRPEARQGHSKGLGTSHIGFRLVKNQEN